ncbi:MAG: DUF6311 domain-containing protein [Halomonas sp.]|uniref:DUF6311 domain-containing protein n=1 Tax=Halomonas sp. TaxID=1486246 RepID=UPI002ACE2983|nr:DUF6311 domain-containing protein [Halomonas sp.]MDZ7853746.1 DUF6311 domain-containing protein [Halomonas sp.]
MFTALLMSGLAWYLYRPVLNPLEVNWLLHEGDTFQHYIGWHFFRREEWGWPLGAIENLASDLSTSIVFTDSLPLLALPLKLFHGWLPDPFQYLGLWMLTNYALNGFFATRLLLRMHLPIPVALAGALLMSSLPIISARGLGMHGHEALTAHWLIFLAIEYTLFLSRPTFGNAAKWLALLTLAVLTHFYLFFMVGTFWAVWWCSHIVREYRHTRHNGNFMQHLKPWIPIGMATPLAVLMVMWSAGYILPGRESTPPGGYGYFSAELLTYFNPSSSSSWFHEEIPSMSRLFKGWNPSIGGQYEGMAYMGAGVLLLWFSVAITWLRSPSTSGNRMQGPALAVLIAAIILFLYALAGRVSFFHGSIPLYYDSLFGPIRDYLRSSGRMVWPLGYVLLIGALVMLTRRWRPACMLPLLALAIVVQREDLRVWYSMVHHNIENRAAAARHDPKPFSVLHDSQLNDVWQSHDRLVAFPAQDLDALKPYLWLAAEHGMSINVAYLASQNIEMVKRATQPYHEAVAQGTLPEGAIYLVTDPELAQQACALEGWVCREHPGVSVIWQSKRTGDTPEGEENQ